jgi:hypothetical protein
MSNQVQSHIEFVLQHDVLLPPPGFGGCSCEDCELLRKWMAERFGKLQEAVEMFYHHVDTWGMMPRKFETDALLIAEAKSQEACFAAYHKAKRE